MTRMSLALAAAMVIVFTAVEAAARPAVNESALDRSIATARQALVMGDSAEAVRLFEQLYSEAPDDPRVLWGLVRACTAAGRDRDCVVPLLEARLARLPEDEHGRRELGEAYARIGEFDPRTRHGWVSSRAASPTSIGTPRSVRSRRSTGCTSRR